MPDIERLKVLMELRRKGPWRRDKDLMSECLHLFPTLFSGLTDGDADKVIEYANKILVTTGYIREPISTETMPGVCVSLWDDEEEEDGFSNLKWSPPKITPIEDELNELDLIDDEAIEDDSPDLSEEIEFTYNESHNHPNIETNHKDNTVTVLNNGGWHQLDAHRIKMDDMWSSSNASEFDSREKMTRFAKQYGGTTGSISALLKKKGR